MDGKQLDRLIDQFEEMIPKERPQLLTEFHFEQSDWKTIWAKAKEIQQGFNTGVHYPTKQLRDKAWQRFNALRDVASKRARQENEQFRATSEMHRSAIFYELKDTRYSLLTDIVVFFDPTTVEEMKAKGRSVRKAKQMLSERKHYMLAEHKSACFELIKEIQESHDLFWEQKRKVHRARNERRAGEKRQRLQANIDENREKLKKAARALERERDKTRDLRSQIASAWNEKWAAKATVWLAEHEARIADIEKWINTLQGWIEENQRALREID